MKKLAFLIISLSLSAAKDPQDDVRIAREKLFSLETAAILKYSQSRNLFACVYKQKPTSLYPKTKNQVAVYKLTSGEKKYNLTTGSIVLDVALSPDDQICAIYFTDPILYRYRLKLYHLVTHQDNEYRIPDEIECETSKEITFNNTRNVIFIDYKNQPSCGFNIDTKTWRNY